jgi:type IV pilus assembly protein PilE
MKDKRSLILNRKGFSLMELIIAVAIAGILAAIAIPVYTSLLKRARAIEAPNALNQIQKMQSSYFSQYSRYGTLEEIGYIPGSPLKYFEITLELTPSTKDEAAKFIATARGNLDGDPDEDVWIIEEEGAPFHTEID